MTLISSRKIELKNQILVYLLNYVPITIKFIY